MEEEEEATECSPAATATVDLISRDSSIKKNSVIYGLNESCYVETLSCDSLSPSDASAMMSGGGMMRGAELLVYIYIYIPIADYIRIYNVE